MIELTKIYLVTNCHGDPNKVYIGKTKNSRENKHKKTFGEYITYDYIDEVNSWNHKDWKPLETFWIRQFKNFGFEVLNENEGGGGPSSFSYESILKLSISSIGKGVKPILQYDIKGNFIKEWPSLTEVENILGIKIRDISNCIKGNQNTSGGFVWRFKNNPLEENFSYIKYKNTKIKKDKPVYVDKKSNRRSIKVIQFDLDGSYIKEWDNMKSASLFFNKNSPISISNCCNNKAKQAYGFIWKFK